MGRQLEEVVGVLSSFKLRMIGNIHVCLSLAMLALLGDAKSAPHPYTIGHYGRRSAEADAPPEHGYAPDEYACGYTNGPACHPSDPDGHFSGYPAWDPTGTWSYPSNPNPYTNGYFGKRSAEAKPQLLGYPYAGLPYAYSNLPSVGAVAHAPVVKSDVITPAEVSHEVAATPILSYAHPVIGYGKRSADEAAHAYNLPYYPYGTLPYNGAAPTPSPTASALNANGNVI